MTDIVPDFALVDAEDAEKCLKHSWCVSQGYAISCFKGRKIPMHRFVLGYGPNDYDDFHVDHINHNRLDNRKCNLRIVTPEANQVNKIGRTNEKMQGVKVCFTHYSAEIVDDGRKIHIGRFATAEEAARAYDKKAIELHGEFASLNFPDEKRNPPIDETKIARIPVNNKRYTEIIAEKKAGTSEKLTRRREREEFKIAYMEGRGPKGYCPPKVQLTPEQVASILDGSLFGMKYDRPKTEDLSADQVPVE